MDVLEKARELGEALFESETYRKMKEAEDKHLADVPSQEAVMAYNEERNAIMERMRKEVNGKSFCLLENILLPNSAIAEFEENLERFLSTESVDQLCLYYYGHNNEDPERVQKITNSLLSKYISRFK